MTRNNPLNSKPGHNILLINPWMYDFTAYDLWLRPMGLLILSGFLKSHGYNIVLLDCLDRSHPILKRYEGNLPKRKENGSGKYLAEDIDIPKSIESIPRKYKRYGIPFNLTEAYLQELHKPDLIMVSSLMSYWWESTRDMIKLVKEIYPEVPVFAGGIYPSIYPEHCIRECNPDYIQVSNNLEELLIKVDKVLGISRDYRDIDFSIEKNYYPDYSFVGDRSSLPMMTSVGCPFDCPFCVTPLRWGKFRPLDLDRIVNDVTLYNREYGVRNFAFYDDALFFRKESHFYPFAEKLLKKKVQASFFTPNSLFARAVDGKMAETMKEMNFVNPRLSYESVDLELQKKMKKVDNSDLSNAIKNLEDAGFRRSDMEIYLLFGLPNQDKECVIEGMKYINDLGAKIHLTYYSPLKGTVFGDSIIEKYFPEDHDPALTNKFGFLTWHYKIGVVEFEEIREIKRHLNSQLD
ncbi:MAG: cobalamin-dependent protein [Acidobacteria bacterium]|nr:cobalamin-dependent protein [Acidobacteriota bacterium]